MMINRRTPGKKGNSIFAENGVSHHIIFKLQFLKNNYKGLSSMIINYYKQVAMKMSILSLKKYDCV